VTLSDIETIIQQIGALFLERHGVAVPFLFGPNEYIAHKNRNTTAVFWLPVRSTVVTATQPKKTPSRLPEKPQYYRVERFEVVCWDNTFAGLEALHRAVLDTLGHVPGEIELGDYDPQSKAANVAAPLLNGEQIVQEVAIVTEVPNGPTDPGAATTLWTVRRTEHECALIRDDGTEETVHTIPEPEP